MGNGILFLMIWRQSVSIVYAAIQFIETSLLFSAFLFCAIMFVRTKDRLAGRTLILLFPVASLLFISYMYISNRSSSVQVNSLEWLSPLFALVVIALIMASILAACYYVIQLFPVDKSKKRFGLIISTALVSALLIITGILVMYISKSDLTLAITNALWAFYPLCSIALFLAAIALASTFKKISNPHHQKLARYFMAAFIPQIAFSIVDFILLRNISFQLTHLSYAVFSLLVFLDLCAYFFKKYNSDLDISSNKHSLKDRYALSDRELEVVVLLAQGMTNIAISENLYISVNTVKSHIKSIYKKLNISNRLQLINMLNGTVN